MSDDAYCKKHFISYCPELSKECPYCRIIELKATIKRVDVVRKELATQVLNGHAVKMLDKALAAPKEISDE